MDRRRWRWLIVLILVTMTAACGSGGGGGEPVATPPGATTPVVAPPAPAGTLQLSDDSYVADEAGGTVSITLTRTGGSAGEVAVRVTTSDDSAVAAADYSAFDSVVVFADGDTAPKVVLVSILDDTLDEADETLMVTLVEPAGGASLGAQSNAALTITDDDALPANSALSLDIGIKQFNFSWTASSGATSYRLLQDPLGMGMFTQVGAELPADAH